MVQIKVSEVEKKPLQADPARLTSVTSSTPRPGPELRAVRVVRREER